MEFDGSNQVLYKCIAMLDASGFGSYTESGLVIPCTYNGETINYIAQMYLNDEPPITAGHEI
jgi:acetoacetate decarboxylase